MTLTHAHPASASTPRERPKPSSPRLLKLTDALIVPSALAAIWLLFGRDPALTTTDLVIGSVVTITLTLGTLILTRAAAFTRKAGELPQQFAPFELSALAALLVIPVVLAAPSPPAWLSICGLIIIGWLLACIYLIWSGLPRRVGRDRRCAKCDYEFPYFSVWDAPERCPECGISWLRRLTLGRRVVSRPRSLLGAALLLLGAGLFIGPAVGGRFYRALPDDLLVWVVTHVAPSSPIALKELEGRTLLPSALRTYAEVLLPLSTDGDYQQRQRAQGYLDGLIAAKTMPTGLTDRYYARLAPLRLDAPRSVRIGEPVTLRLFASEHWLGPRHLSAVALWGAYVDDQPAFDHWPKALPLISDFPGVISTSNFPAALNSVCLDTPGPHTIRVVAWVIVKGRNRRPSPDEWLANWDLDGVPRLATTALWYRRVELTETVEVEPAAK